MNNLKTIQLLSPNLTDRRELLLTLIEKLNCVSVETLSVITGLDKRVINKSLKNLKGHERIRVVTKQVTTYWGVSLNG